MIAMAARSWWRWGGDETADEAAAREEQHRLRHDFGNSLNRLAVKATELRHIADSLDAEVAYFRASGRKWEPNDPDHPMGDAGRRGAQPPGDAGNVP